LLIVTSYLSLFSDGMHEALEIIGAWMKFIQFSFLFGFPNLFYSLVLHFFRSSFMLSFP
jgi:hypothetical protein